MTSSEAAPVDAGGDRAADRLHFRVLAIAGARKGFRLEMIYWRTLELMAERNGRTVAAEVESRLDAAPGAANQSSMLRASLTSDLFQAWREAEGQVARPDWSGLVAAFPAPAFLVSRRSALLAVNEPLLSMLQTLRSEPGAPFNTLQGAADLRVRVPDSASAELRSATGRKFVVCNVVFLGQGQSITCKARLIPAQGASPLASNLIGFVGGL
jgi:predicted DNA-binding ribbon-helix-helix protein